MQTRKDNDPAIRAARYFAVKLGLMPGHGKAEHTRHQLRLPKALVEQLVERLNGRR